MQFRVQCAVGENLYINCDLIIVGHDNNIDNDAVLVDDAEERDLAQVANVADYEEETNLISDYDDYEEYPTVTDYDYSNEVDEDVEGSQLIVETFDKQTSSCNIEAAHTLHYASISSIKGLKYLKA